ncbi:hypothetical protein [Natronorubrum sulfidifaciens]|uniref:Uncharacterized protein n=1 Tax=Natronorubrum sulfidifaciens JCM 14089 TaxID=1230460 RepID=L9VVG2_9EURY|nr:hypothetical protein [Natronorubrum sulfidifaciens]ELY41174.1 hypothetical protein C495_16795 [Natronorubrum sulfidifaciens JCM 14089]
MGADNPPPTDEKIVDDVYHDRNLLAIAFARAMRLTWGPDTAGWYRHDDWPVVWVDMLAGQKSWHVTPDLERSPLENSEPTNGYDGNSRAIKNRRLTRYITRSY